MSEHDAVLEGLRYIADSPPHEHGGFHPEAVKTAKGALALVHELLAEVERLTMAEAEAMTLVLNHEGAIERLTRERDEASAMLNAMGPVLTRATKLADRYQREAMTAREAIHIGDPIDPLTLSGVGIEWPQVAAYRAIRAENENSEKAS